jgi:hypothetical protein
MKQHSLDAVTASNVTRLQLDQHKNMTLHCNHNTSLNKMAGNQCPLERHNGFTGNMSSSPQQS